MHDAKWKSAVRRKLLKWFDENQRDLPWRKKKTPYRIWVSEIMLQQTQVVTVVDYFNRFVKQFPTVKKLAAASEADVLKLWEGLGYYRRARQMHAAAQVVVEKHAGKFPTQFDDVLALPGIGRYTAGAICSIALDQPKPILEGNTIRLFARLMTMKTDPRSTENQRALWEFSESILPRKRAGDFNQSLMELGSEVCHPKRPRCLLCPIQSHCPTFVQGLQDQIPAAAKKKMVYESINEAAIVVQRGSKFLIRQCGPGERWEGLWDFPRYGLEKANDDADLRAEFLAEKLENQTGLTAELQSTKKSIKHAVTRYRIKLDCYAANSVKGRLKKSSTPLKWMTVEEIAGAPMSVTGRKIANMLE
ncbi:MAG: A/G-specific adenine glycosylase [Mariniblastus sp.]